MPMKVKPNIALFMILLFLFPHALRSQLIFSGDFDGRVEYLNVRRTVPDSLNNKKINLLGSAELDLAYNHPKWGAFASLGATYTKGTNLYSITVPPAYSLNIYQAWLRYSFSNRISLQAGRIEIEYDEGRFFEARDWNNLVTSHNAVIAHYLAPDSGLWNDLGFAANRFGNKYLIFSTNPAVNSYRYMAYWYFLKKFYDNQITLSLNDIFNADDNGVNKELLYGRNTVGGNLWLAWPLWDINLAGFYQAGHVNDGRQLSAYYFAAYFALHPVDWLNLMPAFEHLSGDNLADSAEWRHVVHGFSLLYGNMTRSFGQSGAFYNFRSNIHPALNNLYFKATFILSEKVSIEANYHWLTVPNNYRLSFSLHDSTKVRLEKVDPTMMQEGDVKLTWMPLRNLEVDLFYSLIFPGPGMQNMNGWDFSPKNPVSYAYLEVDWTPVFLTRNNRKTLNFH